MSELAAQPSSPLSEAVIRALFPRAAESHVRAFLENYARLFTEYGIDNEFRLTFFLAQIGHESGGLTLLEENLNYSAQRLCAVFPSRFPSLTDAATCAGNAQNFANTVYGGRMGNTQPGDGFLYHGRGYIQLTGRDGYRNVAIVIGRHSKSLDLERDPTLVMDPEHALEVALAFWEWKSLNHHCDAGDAAAFAEVTRRINGGTVGLSEREAWLAKVRRTLKSPPAASEPAPDVASIVALQRALWNAGYTEVGAADGIVGVNTLSAIRHLRADRKLGPGGIDSTLLASLGGGGVERVLET